MKTFNLFNFNMRSSAMVQADGCTAARQKIGVTPRTTSTIGRFASVLCLILTMLLTLGVGEMEAAWIGNSGINVNDTWYRSTNNIDGGNWLEGCTYFQDHDFGAITSLVLGGQYDTWDNNQTDACNWNSSNGIHILIKKGSTTIADFKLSCYHHEKSGNNNVWKTSGGTNGCSDSGSWGTYTVDISGYAAGEYTIKATWFSPSGQSLNNTAKFTIAPVVTFKANGGTGDDYTQRVTYNTNTALTTNTFTKTGYDFAGWATSAGGSVTYADKANVKLTAHTDLYAKWTAKTPTINFNQQGGSGGSSSVTATYDAAMPSATMPTLSGYTFGGYYTSTGGGGTKYYNADGTSAKTCDLASTTTLYAKWTQTITLDEQGATTSGTTSKSVTYNSSSGMSTMITRPSKTGYDYAGYYTDIAGNGSMIVGTTGAWQASVSGYTDASKKWIKASGATTIYAKWTQTVTLNANTDYHGSGTNKSATATWNGTALSGFTATSAATGYSLIGYYSAAASGTKVLNADGTYAGSNVTSYITSGKWTKSGATTLYAHMRAKTYSVTLDKNGGDSGGSVTATYNSSSLDDFSGASYEGYSCDGYFTASDGGTKIINADGTLVSSTVAGWLSSGYWVKDAADVTLYAHWTEDVTTYTLHYTYGTGFSTRFSSISAAKTSGGDAVADNASLASGTGVTLTATPADHYKFVGWYSAAGCAANTLVSTNNPYSFSMSDNTNLYAKAELMTTTITFNKNGGSGSTPSTLTATHGSSSLSSGYVAPTRDGYTLSGWYTEESGGTRVLLSAGTTRASVSGYTDGSGNWIYTGAALTLYAHWTAKTYKVTFDKQSGAGGSDNVTATYNAAMPSATMPTRTGYDFQGYYGSTGGSGTKYYNSDASSAHVWDVAEATTIYANWSIKNYSITYSPSSAPTGCTYTTKPTSADYNSTVTMVITPSTGYTVSVSAVDASSNVVTISNPSANTYTFTQPASAVTVTVTATETKSTVTVTTATTTHGSLKFGETSKSWGATASVGVATTQSITATAAEGFSFARWDLSGSAASSSDLTSATIILKADGSGSTGTATAVFEEDLSSPYVLKGGTVFGGTAWETEHALTKKSGSSTINRAYFSVAIDKTNTGASDEKYQFKIYKPSTDTYYGLTGTGQFYYERSHSANAMEMSSPGINIELRADKTGTYEIEVDYRESTPKITILFPGQNLHGNFTGEWASHEFEDGKVSVNITSIGTYEFKVSDGAWYGNNATISETETDWVFYSDHNNCHLEVSTTGTYIFGWNRDDKILSVFYPADQENLTLTKNTYIYFDARDMTGTNEDYWQRGDFTAKFWFKDFASGVDVGNNECAKSSALDGWVYYAEVPNNDYVGRIQLNRLPVGGEGLCSSNVAHAYLRTEASQNCLTSESGKEDYCNSWTPQWSTYAPPLTALSLSNNSTTTYGGSGTKANPYIVNVGDQVKVRASGTKAVNDDNMTIYYTFKDNTTTIGSEGSSATCNYSTGAENAVHKMTVTARNRLLETSTYGTVKTTSDTIYFTRKVVYTGLTVSKSPAAGSATAPTISSTWAIKGNNVTVTAYEPATGYRFTGWTSSNGSFASASSLSTTFTPTAANAVAVANYELINYTIIHSASTNGSYTIKVGDASAVSTNTTATYGQTITLAATPSNATFYKFDEWTVTGATPASTTSANTTFTMPAGNVTVAASFVQVNLAEGKTVVAGYEPNNASEHSDKITDGRTDNDAWVTWVDQDEADEWFYVDLGAFYQLNNVEVVWGADYSTDYIIQARQNAPASSAEAADDKCWFTLAEVTDATANSTKSTSVNAPARYVRLHSLSRSNNCIRVKEFRVFGTATATAYTTPTLSTAEVDNYPSNYEDVVLHLVGTDSKSTAIHTYKITDESSNVSIVTTDGDNLVTISGLSKFEHHTLTVQAMDPGALLSASQNVAVLIWDPTYNMAQGKTIVAGYEPVNPDEHSEYAVDGSTSTGWTTYDNQPESVEWFYVDLGAYYQLSRIELVWGEVYSTDYVLEVRQDVPATSAIAADDNLWFPVAEVKDATASSTKSTAVDVRARYVRCHSLSRSAGFLRLYEFRVFTTRFADADTNVPVITTATASYNDDGKAYLNLTATDVEDGTTKWFYLYNPATSSYSLQQTNGSNQFVIDGLTECENYTFQVQAMDTAAKLSVVSNIAVRVPIISTTNLARGKTATAGTTQGGFVAANAVDGNTGSMWSGNYDRKDNENQWISIDLADKYSIDSIKITWGGNDGTWPQDYELQVSYDGSDYQPIGHYTTKPANQNCKYTFTNVSARYVRVWAITAGSTYGMEICEIAVHGDCYDDTELPIMLFAEAEEHNVYVSAADIYVGAIHKSIASENLLYHVEYTSTGGDSGSRTISPSSITDGVFSLNELNDNETYTVNIWAAKTSDISSNRSANYRTVSFTTLELGGNTQYYFAGNMNGWLGVNDPAGWSPDPVEWRFKTTAINGIYKLSHSVSTTDNWAACFVYDKNNSTRTLYDHTISVTKDNDFIITMKGLESYISNSHTIYIAGDAVGTAVDAEDAAHALTWTDGTHASWEGYVTSGETFKLIFHDQGAAGNKRTDVLTPSAVTYDGSAHYAKITFDLDTWTYEWSATDVSTYIYDDNSGDGKWSTTSNWLSGALPTIEKDVIITKPVTVDITTARANSVVLDQSGDNTGQLVLDAGKELVVAGTVRKTTDGSNRLATGENDLVFNSTSGAGLGALVMGTHDGTNNATVNFATLSNGEEDNTASDAQYVGTPFGNHPKMVYQFYNSWMYKFINTGVPGWTRVDGEDGLDAFQGYCIFSADGTGHSYWMQGTLVASTDQTINLRHNGGDGSNANNENMLANSWMAPIQIAAFDASDFTNADATIYIYNTGSPDDYSENNGATSTGTQAGQYSLYTVNTCPTTAIIPSMQAFSVYTHGSTPSISLDYSKIVYDPAVAGSVVPGRNRAPQRTETDEPEKMRLYIGAESGYGDMLYMLEREDFAEGFENGWDGRKMFGEDVAPQLYAFTPDGNMAINCIPTFEGQLLGFRKGAQDNTYTFTFEYDGDNMWYLNDLKEQTSTLISAFDSYTFTSEADDTEARFIISRSPIHSTPTAVESATGAQQPAIRKIVINDHVFIIRNGLMYDVTGIMVR